MILGGAALTPRFVQKDCRSVYNGQVIYGRDAFADLRFMDALMEAKAAEGWDDLQGFLNGIPEGVGLSDGPAADGEAAVAEAAPAEAVQKAQAGPNDHRSDSVPEERLSVR